jgi:hypothetical protein
MMSAVSLWKAVDDVKKQAVTSLAICEFFSEAAEKSRLIA